jgi:hypothetical protein
MSPSTLAAIGFLALTLTVGGAAAQTPPATQPAPATTPAKPATPPPATTQGKPRTPESIQCSAEADAKKLTGNERRKFRDRCMRAARKAAATAGKAPPAAPGTSPAPTAPAPTPKAN